MTAIAPETFLSMGLNQDEFDLLCKLMGRDPTLTELGMFAVMWSEHCGYKYSRPVLRYFKRYREAMEAGGHENAGVVDIGDGWGITMKVESHNHPSAVEPYQGAATGVGGILRDIFTMGARPIGSLNSLRFGPIEPTPGVSDETVQRNRYLFRRVVAGIGGYGNCVGVPTIGGEVTFHPRYSGNPLVNAMAVGVVRITDIATAEAQGVGNPVIYLGSATGRDGIHGATFASDALDEQSESKRPNVQIGDPFAEKLLIEATLEALKTGAVVAIQDMGAAGLTCSTIEMSSKGKVGMDIDLDRVPIRERDMSCYEIMLSESQERMLAVAHKGRENEIIDVFHKWGAHAEVIGHVTDSGVVRIQHHGKLEVELDATWLTDYCPTYETPCEEPEYAKRAKAWSPDTLPPVDLKQALLTLVGSPSLASKRWVYEQYDQQVQTQTTLLPGQGDAAVLALRGTKAGIALKLDGNGRQIYFDPYGGAQAAVAEAARNVACVGARPRAVTDGLNFGNPRQPHVYWQFSEAVKGIADACEALGTPVISGNVSFYNESELGEVLPTPLIGMLGILSDADQKIGMGLPAQDAEIWIIGYRTAQTHQGLGASSFLADVHGIEDGCPIPPEMEGEKRLIEFLVQSAAAGNILAAHDISEGGLALCLAEMALTGSQGVEMQVPEGLFGPNLRDEAIYFGEFPGHVIVCFDEDRTKAIEELADSLNLGICRLGKVMPHREAVQIGAIDTSLAELRVLFEGAIPHNMQNENARDRRIG